MQALSSRKQDRQTTILSAAITVMARKGYHQTRISDIAAEAGVAYGLVYHYFNSKEEILSAILGHIGERFNRRFDKIQQLEIPSVQRLHRIADYMLDTCIARPDLIQLLIQEVLRAPGEVQGLDVARQIHACIVTIIKQGQGSKEIDPGLNPQVIALSFFGSVEMLMSALFAGLLPESTSKTTIRRLKSDFRNFLYSGSFGRSAQSHEL